MKTFSKKFALCCAIGIASLLACTSNQEKKSVAKTDTISSTDTSAISPPSVSMNGIPKDEAIQMIKDFRADSTIDQQQASIWLDKEFINTLMETAEQSPVKIDGVRIHMAKRDKKNTVVVLLTTEDGLSTIHKGRKVHRDLFMPYSSALGSLGVQNKDSFDRPEGADLYKTACTSNCTGSDSESYVDCQTAKRWVDNFTEFHRGSKLVDLRSSWYNINLFKRLRGQLSSAEADKSDGVRIYFTRNDQGKHAFILVPTTKMQKGGHKDNYTCYINFVEKDTYDRGEECTPFCDGVVVP